jgi:hypothetical protein
LSASGEEIDVPEKIFDDFYNAGQMAYVGNQLTGSSLTTDQKVQMLMPQEAKVAMATASTASQKFGAGIIYEFEQDIAKMALGLDELEETFEWE